MQNFASIGYSKALLHLFLRRRVMLQKRSGEKLMEIVVQNLFYINEIYGLYILETALKSTSCATVIFSSSKIRETPTETVQSTFFMM
jgi:hypothetical protein